MQPTNMMTLHRYKSGKIQTAMVAITEEAEKVSRDGYELVGYQVVESERCITTLYKKVVRSAPQTSSLVGE